MRLLPALLLGFGLVFGGIGLLVTYGARWLGGHSASTVGEVVDYRTSRSREGNVMYAPVVAYLPADETELRMHVPASRQSWRSFEVGERVRLRHHPTEPGRASLDEGPGLFGWVFMGAGALFGTLGAFVLARPVLRKRTRERLLREGRRVSAEVTAIAYDTSVQVDGRSPYRVLAQWHDERANAVRLFESEPIWYDPSEFIAPGHTVSVYLDRERPERYAMNLGKLPRAVG